MSVCVDPAGSWAVCKLVGKRFNFAIFRKLANVTCLDPRASILLLTCCKASKCMSPASDMRFSLQGLWICMQGQWFFDFFLPSPVSGLERKDFRELSIARDIVCSALQSNRLPVAKLGFPFAPWNPGAVGFSLHFGKNAFDEPRGTKEYATTHVAAARMQVSLTAMLHTDPGQAMWLVLPSARDGILGKVFFSFLTCWPVWWRERRESKPFHHPCGSPRVWRTRAHVNMHFACDISTLHTPTSPSSHRMCSPTKKNIRTRVSCLSLTRSSSSTNDTLQNSLSFVQLTGSSTLLSSLSTCL